MAFPNDARIATYAVLSPWPSATANALQDGILGIASGATATVQANGAVSRWGTARADWICDGTDDQVQIQAAIDWVFAQGGGTVMLSRGIFYVASLVEVKTSVRLIGQGRGATILKIPPAIAFSFALLGIGTAADVTIQALTLDGNKAAIGAFEHDGIRVHTVSPNCHIIDVSIKNMNLTAARGKGLILEAGRRALISGVQIQDCEGMGIDAQATAEEYQIVGTSVYGSSYVTLDGVYGSVLGLQTTLCDVRLIGSYIRMLGGDIRLSPEDGISVGAASRCLIQGMHIGLNNLHGIEIAATAQDVMICDNIIESNSQAVDDTSNGIDISGASSRITMVGNKIRLGTAPLQQRFGIYIANAGAANCYVYGNDLVGAGKTSNYSDPGGLAKTLPRYSWDGAAHQSHDLAQANIIA